MFVCLFMLHNVLLDAIMAVLQTSTGVRTTSVDNDKLACQSGPPPASDELVSTTALFAGYKRRRIELSDSNWNSSVDTQLGTYLALCDEDIECTNAFSFWSMHRSRLGKIFPLAMRVLSVPASSAPIERVFSHGGIIMRPHRSRLGDKTLGKLVFLKCNNLHKK